MKTYTQQCPLLCRTLPPLTNLAQSLFETSFRQKGYTSDSNSPGFHCFGGPGASPDLESHSDSYLDPRSMRCLNSGNCSAPSPCSSTSRITSISLRDLTRMDRLAPGCLAPSVFAKENSAGQAGLSYPAGLLILIRNPQWDNTTRETTSIWPSTVACSKP